MNDITTDWELDQAKADEFHRKGMENYKKERFEEAVKGFTKAIQLNPRKAQFYFDRCRAHANLGDEKNAQVDFNQAVIKGLNLGSQSLRILNDILEDARREKLRRDNRWWVKLKIILGKLFLKDNK